MRGALPAPVPPAPPQMARERSAGFEEARGHAVQLLGPAACAVDGSGARRLEVAAVAAQVRGQK